MSDNETRKSVRKGTKSCVECRRRKVRCIRVPEDSPTCRRCEERGTECTLQIFSKSSSKSQKSSSRYRISLLESKVGRLSKVVHDLELKLGHQPTESINPSEPAIGSPVTEESDEDDDLSIVDVPITEQPSHLRSLFHNDWLTVDHSQSPHQIEERKEKASSYLIDIARLKLQRLIPPKNQIEEISESSFNWLRVLQTVLPQPYTFNAQKDLLEYYEKICQPNVDVMVLANWLLTVALTAPRDSQEYATHNENSRAEINRSYSRIVSDEVENTIISHDRLIGTVQGLATTMHFIRLQLSFGYFQRAWVRLRHVIAISELMGLPRSFRVFELQNHNASTVDESLFHRAQLWESIYLADRLFGMLINLPPGTRNYPQITPAEVVIGGIVQTKVYMKKLADISVKLQDRDDLGYTPRSKAETYAITMTVDKELRELASKVPKTWWNSNSNSLEADHIVPFLHCCILTRAHLPYTLHQDSSTNLEYSRQSCIEACEAVLRKFMVLSELLPPSIFLSQFIILQSFASAIVLLLVTQSLPSPSKSSLPNTVSRTQEVVQHVVDVMESKYKSRTGSHLVQHVVSTIRSLHKLLGQNERNQSMEELTLKVPMLGTIRIRRNEDTQENTIAANQMQSGSRLAPRIETPFINYAQIGPGFQLQGEWEWDPTSWTAEDLGGDFLQSHFAMDELDALNVWQAGIT